MRVFKPNIPKLEAKRDLRRLTKALDDKDAQVGDAAAEALITIGEDAVPHLVDFLVDKSHLPKVRDMKLQGTTVGRVIQYRRPSKMVDVLSDIGQSAVPALIRALDNPNPDTRVNTLLALTAMGTKAVDAVPALMDMLGDPNSRVQAAAMSAIAAIGPAAQDAVPQLVILMKDSDFRKGESSLLNVSKLFDHLQSSSYDTGDASSAIREIGEAAVPVLLSTLGAAASPQRHNVALVLGEIEHDVESTVPPLIALLSDSDVRVRGASAWSLGKIGSQAAEAIPHLMQMLSDTDEHIRAVAAEAVERIRG